MKYIDMTRKKTANWEGMIGVSSSSLYRTTKKDAESKDKYYSSAIAQIDIEFNGEESRDMPYF